MPASDFAAPVRPASVPYILGLDLGARSIGWAVLKAMNDHGEVGEPCGVLAAGSRLFDAGVEGDVEKGLDSSRAAARRMNRLTRRQLFRRSQRIRNTVKALARLGFTPGLVGMPPEDRDRSIKCLDEAIKQRLISQGHAPDDVHGKLPCLLRKLCLDGPRPVDEVGRALLHLSQRRGFLSNRKAVKKDDEKGKVKQGIGETQRLIEQSGSRTLGEMLAGLDPHVVRLRAKYTARRMYLEEFDAIWAAQAPHHPGVMTEDARQLIRHTIFHQRPLKSAKALVGQCDLEEHKRRAPMACLIYQRFRLIQRVNDLTWRDESGALCGPLGVDDPRRAELIHRLDTEGDLTLTEVKKTLGLPPKAKLMLEAAADKKLPGNRTAQALREALGETWDRWDLQTQTAFVDELISGMNEAEFKERARTVYGLTEKQVEELGYLELQQGYAAYSRRAMRKLLPEMEAGVPLMTAVKKRYPNAGRSSVAMDRLPPLLGKEVRKQLGRINNPAVIRTLTELRKLVNAIVRRYGKPERVRIELGRDLKASTDERKRRTDTIEKRTKERQRIIAEMKKKLPAFAHREPSRADVEKWELMEECNGMCPYSGKSITPALLFGEDAEFEVEHIVPRSVRPDDSFTNKTLCWTGENKVKGNRTPFQAYGGDPQRWAEILARVSRFSSPAARAKLKLFQMQEVSEEFVQRDLNDTRYSSRLAMGYLGLLYGGANGVDPGGVRRIQASCGSITATLRNEWGINRLLGGSGEKVREDHRHHALDAVVIGMVSPRTVQVLASAAASAAAEGRRRYARLPDPWPGFLAELGDVLDKMVVSHRVDHRLAGGLHKASNYSPPKAGVETKEGKPTKKNPSGVTKIHVDYRHIRKPLKALTPGDVAGIVDERVRKLVEAALNGGDPEKVFASEANLPRLPNRSGPPRVIRRVRVRCKANLLAVGGTPGRGGPGTVRHVATAENSHLEVVEATDAKGTVTWELDHIVSRFEAHRRLRMGEPVVRTDWGPGRRLVMVLRKGDVLRLTVETAAGPVRQLMRVTGVTAGEVQTYRLNDGRPTGAKHPERSYGRFTSGKSFRAANPEPVSVSPLGEVSRVRLPRSVSRSAPPSSPPPEESA